MKRREFLAVSAAATIFARGGRAIAQSRPATTQSTTVPADLQWHDVRDWGVEGRGFSDTSNYFDRLPARAQAVVRPKVWELSRHTAGMSARFNTDADAIHIRYALTSPSLAMPHMPATGVSGVDLYAREAGGWRWCATHQPTAQQIEATLVSGLPSGTREYELNLPLYNGVTSLEIGVAREASFAGTPPREIPPILFYGTSITQGGCASRPGLAFVSILGRRLDRPMLNFGFSGNGKTELEVGRFLAELDPAIFVLDCMANMQPEWVHDRTVSFVKHLRGARPELPILLLEDRDWASATLAPATMILLERKRAELRRAVETLRAENVGNSHAPRDLDLIGTDGEGTVDGSHPNDLGMMRYADALEPVLRELLA